jgi:hypothetical protein
MATKNARHVLQSLLLSCLLAPLPASAGEVVDLVPDERAAWGAANVFAPITGLFLGGPNYWYKAREIEVETIPPGALLDLFYVRASFQKRYEQAEAPVTIRLPSRVEAGKRDRVTIRALLDGYRQEEVRVPVRSRQRKVVIELSPLPNSLLAVTHRYFAGRASLAFLTKEALTFRIQKGADGFSLVLAETGEGAAEGTINGVSSPLVKSLRARQLGEDLVIQVALTAAATDEKVEVRSRQAFDAVRGVHSFGLDLVPADGGVEAVHRAKAALARIRSEDVAGCALAYDAALREQLEAAALARALAPDGSFTDPYLREAMKRLGQLSPDGVVTLTDGSQFRTAAPIELMAAASQSAEVVGYLATLREFVAELEPAAGRRETLRGLIAPELAVERFDAVVDTAEASESRCLAAAGITASTERL